jgi:hypothetical protein
MVRRYIVLGRRTRRVEMDYIRAIDRIRDARPRHPGQVIGPDGLVYLTKTTAADFDKRYFRRY